MTSKVALGLMGGGSLTAGLGVGYGVGYNTHPLYKYQDLMNTFYSTLISSAEIEMAAYDELEDDAKTNFLQKYKEDVCGIVEDVVETYKTEKANKRAKEDKVLCNKGDLASNKAEWEKHFKNSAQDLKDEWAEFKEYVYSPAPKKPQ